jgi:hypothetical protein
MIAIFIYGFSFVYLLASIMGYDLSIFQVLLLTFLAYIIVMPALKSKKSTVITILIILIGIVVSGVILYITNNLSEVREQAWLFIEPYFNSIVKGQSVSLGIMRQTVIIFLISALIYKVLDSFKEFTYSYYVFVISSVLLLTIGFTSSRLSAPGDRLSIMIFAAAQFMYYFYYYYTEVGLTDMNIILYN